MAAKEACLVGASLLAMGTSLAATSLRGLLAAMAAPTGQAKNPASDEAGFLDKAPVGDLLRVVPGGHNSNKKKPGLNETGFLG